MTALSFGHHSLGFPRPSIVSVCPTAVFLTTSHSRAATHMATVCRQTIAQHNVVDTGNGNNFRCYSTTTTTDLGLEESTSISDVKSCVATTLPCGLPPHTAPFLPEAKPTGLVEPMCVCLFHLGARDIWNHISGIYRLYLGE